MASTFSASGLASGLDTASIVDKLVQLESAPLTALQKQQTGLKAQVSALADIASKLSAFQSAIESLASDGALGLAVTSTNTAFQARASSTASAGEYSVQVTRLAQTAKARSDAFLSTDTVKGGVLHLKVQGTTYNVTVADGSSLATVASQIRASGAPVSATILTSGTSSYLSLTDRDSGYPLSGVAADALTITQDLTGTLGKPLAFAPIQAAENAVFSVDGLSFTRTSNLVADALPGVTLTLSAPGGPETLTLAAATSATQARLQTLVDAYNGVMGLINAQLAPGPRTDRSATLAGDNALRPLQMKLQSLLSTVVAGSTTVRSLADVGLKTAQDGTLSISTATLEGALARDPGALNNLFARASTGLSALTTALVQGYTNSVNGILVTDQQGLNQRISTLSQRQVDLQAQVDTYRATLVARFTAMETLISQLKSTGNYLTTLSSLGSTNGSSNGG